MLSYVCVLMYVYVCVCVYVAFGDCGEVRVYRGFARKRQIGFSILRGDVGNVFFFF